MHVIGNDEPLERDMRAHHDQRSQQPDHQLGTFVPHEPPHGPQPHHHGGNKHRDQSDEPDNSQLRPDQKIAVVNGGGAIGVVPSDTGPFRIAAEVCNYEVLIGPDAERVVGDDHTGRRGHRRPLLVARDAGFFRASANRPHHRWGGKEEQQDGQSGHHVLPSGCPVPDGEDRGDHDPDAEQADGGASAARQGDDRTGGDHGNRREVPSSGQEQRERRHDSKMRSEPQDVPMTKGPAGGGVAANILLGRDQGLDQGRRAEPGHQSERRPGLRGGRPSDGQEHDDRSAKLPDVEDGRRFDLRHERGEEQGKDIDTQSDLETEGRANRRGGKN